MKNYDYKVKQSTYINDACDSVPNLQSHIYYVTIFFSKKCPHKNSKVGNYLPKE